MSTIIQNDNITQTRRITWIGMFVNIGLSVAKFVLGILGASQALVADAVHSLSDLSTDFAVLIGVSYWTKPPDDNHPYGHRRIETLVSAAIGFALFVVAVGIGYHALATMRDEDIRQPGLIALAGALLSIVLKEIIYRWTVIIGKRLRSPALIANAWHHRTDALSSIPVAIAIAAVALNPQWAFIDHIGAFVVSLFIIHASWSIISPAFSELVDKGASRDVQDRITKIAMAVEGVESVHAVRTRRMGTILHIDLHVMVDSEMTVEKGHEISHDVKRELLEQGPDVGDVIVHLEPFIAKV
ncbi:MAG: cation diffusion facilitator family transporter [bacterium]